MQEIECIFIYCACNSRPACIIIWRVAVQIHSGSFVDTSKAKATSFKMLVYIYYSIQLLLLVTTAVAQW